MKNLEQYVATAKAAKVFINLDNDVVIKYSETAKAHINGLADMVLRLTIEVKALADALAASEEKD